MRLVITGATGNIGTALLRALATQGGHEVIGLARRPPDPGLAPYDIADWYAVDLSEPADAARLPDLVDGADAVVHLAWPFQPMRDVAYLDRAAVGGSRAVIAAVERTGVPHLVHMSSLGAYSPAGTDEPVDESWPTGGLPHVPYSREKAAVERSLDVMQERARAEDRPLTVTRVRPSVVLQREAGAALLRYSLPLLPAGILAHLPVLPLDHRFRLQVVHADDVADALVRVLERRPGGAFNLAADDVLRRADLAAALGARPVELPWSALRALAAAAWHARLQPVDPGWLDLAWQAPLLDTGRAHRELGWAPAHPAAGVLAEAVAAMASSEAGSSPALRPRSVLAQLRRAVREGPVSRRRYS